MSSMFYTIFLSFATHLAIESWGAENLVMCARRKKNFARVFASVVHSQTIQELFFFSQMKDPTLSGGLQHSTVSLLLPLSVFLFIFLYQFPNECLTPYVPHSAYPIAKSQNNTA